MRPFSEHVIETAITDMSERTSEQIAEATGIPLKLVVAARNRIALLERDHEEAQAILAQASARRILGPVKSSDHFQVARGIDKRPKPIEVE